MVKGLAARQKGSEGSAYTITLFNHDKIDCDSIVRGAGRRREEGDISVTVHAGAQTVTNVIFSPAINILGREVNILTEPANVGDTVSACVPSPVEFSGDHSVGGQKAVVQGLFSATFCGDWLP